MTPSAPNSKKLLQRNDNKKQIPIENTVGICDKIDSIKNDRMSGKGFLTVVPSVTLVGWFADSSANKQSIHWLLYTRRFYMGMLNVFLPHSSMLRFE